MTKHTIEGALPHQQAAHQTCIKPSYSPEPPPYESVAEGPTEPPPTYSSLYPEPKAPTLSPV